MNTLAQLKAFCKLLTGKESKATTIDGVLSDINANITVSVEDKVVTFKRK